MMSMSVRERPAVGARDRSRCAVRSDRAFFVAARSSRKASANRRSFSADIPSSGSSSPCFPTVGLSMWCPPSLQRVPSVVGGVTVRTEEALGRLGGTQMTTNGAPRRPGSGDRGFAESSGGSEIIPNADSVSETVTVNRLRRVLQAGRRMEPQSRAGDEILNLLISRIK